MESGKGLSFLRRSIATVLLIVPLLLITSNLGSYAASSGGSASGLSISPLRQTLSLKPGQAGAITVILKNITGGPILAEAKVQDFESNNVNGDPKLVTNSNYNDPASIRKFLVGLGNVSLATAQQTTVTIPVQIPANASPGAYYGLIEYQAVPQNSSTTKGSDVVALSAAVSQLVFITVPGNVSDRMQLNAINVYSDKAATKPDFIFTSPPKSVGVILQNVGNAFDTPFGNVNIQNMRGKQVYSYELNGGITRGLVLPNSSRTFTNAIKNISTPGWYTVNVNASYGPGSAILIAKKTVWYIPAWLIIIVLVIILVLIVLILLARRRYKRATHHRHYRH